MKDVRPNSLPKARTDRLIVKELPDETLIYDLDIDEAYCLNLLASRIWKNCDGERTTSGLREEIEKEVGSPIPQDVVALGLDQLAKFRLLEQPTPKSFNLQGVARRDLIKRAGLTALALPAIISLTVAPANAQASLLAPGRCCGNPNQCTSNNCAQSPSCVPPPPAAPSTKACV